MSTDEQIAARGRVLTDYLTAKEQFELANSELASLCDRLRELGAAIASGADSADFTLLAEGERIQALVKERSLARDRKANLAARLRGLGLTQVE